MGMTNLIKTIDKTDTGCVFHKTAEGCLREFFIKLEFPPDRNIWAQAAVEQILCQIKKRQSRRTYERKISKPFIRGKKSL
jgi:hypothetical protein